MKICKKCWEPRNHDNQLISLCKDCYYIKQSKTQQKPRKAIKKIWNNSNTTAKFSVETKKQIIERDKCCIICANPWTDAHHVYFWTECEYWKNRNDVNKWVLLCRLDHAKAHACTKWEGIRQKCIDYLKKI